MGSCMHNVLTFHVHVLDLDKDTCVREGNQVWQELNLVQFKLQVRKNSQQ